MDLLKRVLTAAILIPAVVALVLWAPRWLFLLGVLPVALLALWEFLEMASRVGTAPARLPVYLLSVGVWTVAAYRPEELFAAVVAASFLLFAVSLLRREMTAEVFWAAATGIFSLLYLGVPWALAIDLRAGPQGQWALLYLLLLIWVGDTAAYFAGRGFGRHKLAPGISPGKTVEGTVASLLLTVAAGFYLFRAWFPDMAAVHGVLLPLVVNVAGQVGDLAESALKRSAGVKDSSALLPGHGGVLDRVDALLFALPALWYYWSLLTRGLGQP
ncbi:MAG: phosphatidate cytidylyltransferase [Acidobacteria bacterium]|nr:phosphatidate cytidylyltransferase [Acidobacteriota bacterium]